MESKKLLNKVKIIFVDLDGTLVDTIDDGVRDISNKNKQAINFRNLKKHVIVSTGRSGLQAERYLSKIDYTYAVTGNGAIILKNKKVIKKINMSVKTTLLLIQYVRENNLLVKIDAETNAYGCYSLIHRLIVKMINFTPFPNFNLDLQKKYYKFILWGKTKKRMLEVQNELKNLIPNISIVSSHKGWILEISHKDATKGKANSYVAKKFYGISKKEEMLHIGDSMNDSTCLEYMNVIAMKNATKDFYNLTKLKGPDYKNGGVAKVLSGEFTIEEELLKSKKNDVWKQKFQNLKTNLLKLKDNLIEKLKKEK